MTKSSVAAVLLPSLLAPLAALLGACADPSGSLIIVQNQIPAVDSMSSACVVSTDPVVSRASGLFDIDLDRPYPYFVYPLVQSRLPSIKAGGGIEKNSLLLRAVRVEIEAPAGVDPGWAAGCPGTFDSPATATLDPEQTRALAAQGLQACHAVRLKQLVAAGAIPNDLSQPVYFTLRLTVIAERAGSQLKSDSFPFQVQVCAGCLQSRYPLTPACADAPKPNLLKGNPCNIAQDGPQVLCCSDPGGALVCPAPDL
ncbi:MAG: hypothetical protein ABUL77_03215 [Bacteroidota bacterium]